MKYAPSNWRRCVAALCAAILLAGLGSVLVSHPALAATAKDAVCEGAGLGAGNCATPQGTPDINHTITLVVNVLSWVVGIAAVIMVIVGGLRFVTSGGDATKAAGARSTILYAIIGLVVVALAQVIVKFVLQKVR